MNIYLFVRMNVVNSATKRARDTKFYIMVPVYPTWVKITMQQTNEGFNINYHLFVCMNYMISANLGARDTKLEIEIPVNRTQLKTTFSLRCHAHSVCFGFAILEEGYL